MIGNLAEANAASHDDRDHVATDLNSQRIEKNMLMI